MNYFFVLGRVPCLSFLELASVFSLLPEKPIIESADGGICTVSTESLSMSEVLSRLGGVIKIGECQPYKKDSLFLAETIASFVMESAPPAGRITIGISVYSLPQGMAKGTPFIRTLSLSVKKILSLKNRSVRVVLPTNRGVLSSVQVQKNRLLSLSGYEFILFSKMGVLYVGKTHAVQAFEDYSQRDWHRPAKSHEEGMLPPKIAQIMINLARVSINANTVILDPFCGSGTILQEALLMGYRRVIGSDVDAHAVERARTNLSWITDQKKLPLSGVGLFMYDARNLSRHITPRSIDAIVTEPYLGPLFTKMPSPAHLASVVNNLSILYCAFFSQAAVILKKNALCVVILPVWLGKQKTFLPIYEKILALGFRNETIPPQTSFFCPERTSREGILFHRSGSVVGRELFVFRVRGKE